MREVDAEQVGAHRSRIGVGSYVTRDRDAQLRPRVCEAARTGEAVLVVGESTSGKTRAAWEAVAALVPDRWLFVPALSTDLAPLPDLVKAKGARRSVVWLDDVDKHLNTSTGLDHTLLQRLTSEGALVVMTVRTRAYNTYRHAADDFQSREKGLLEAGRQMFRGLEPVRLERLWSEEELHRATDSGAAGLADAARRQSTDTGHGVTEYLAAAPELAARWHQAKESVGSDGGNPRGHRLVAAAVDLVRIGVEHAPVELLAAAHSHYPLPAHLRPEPFAEALAWATQVQYGTCGLLIPTASEIAEECWRPFDYLPGTTDAPIPEGLWDTALTHTTDPASLFSIGSAAYRGGLEDTAEAAWIRAAEGGNIKAMVNLGKLLDDRGETDEAEDHFCAAAEHGELLAMSNLGILHHKRGETDEAEAWWRQAIEHGHSPAMATLGILLIERGETDEAADHFRAAAEHGELLAMSNLGSLLNKRGETDEAEAWWRRAAEHGDATAMFGLGVLMRKRNDDEAAEGWYARAAKNGNTDAMVNLGTLHNKRGETDQAEDHFRAAAEHGNAMAMFNLGILMEERNDHEAAEGWYARAAKNGDTEAMNSLGTLRYVVGRVNEAETWFREAAEHGHTNAMKALGVLLKARGEFDEAETWNRRRAAVDQPVAGDCASGAHH